MYTSPLESPLAPDSDVLSITQSPFHILHFTQEAGINLMRSAGSIHLIRFSVLTVVLLSTFCRVLQTSLTKPALSETFNS